MIMPSSSVRNLRARASFVISALPLISSWAPQRVKSPKSHLHQPKFHCKSSLQSRHQFDHYSLFRAGSSGVRGPRERKREFKHSLSVISSLFHYVPRLSHNHPSGFLIPPLLPLFPRIPTISHTPASIFPPFYYATNSYLFIPTTPNSNVHDPLMISRSLSISLSHSVSNTFSFSQVPLSFLSLEYQVIISRPQFVSTIPSSFRFYFLRNPIRLPSMLCYMDPFNSPVQIS